jgi:uncharacterized membrane protein
MVAHAEMLPERERIVSGHLELFGKSLPLPPGAWRVASTSFGRVVGASPGPYGSIGSVLLTRPTDDPDRAFVLLRTNALPVRDGWGPPPECLSDQVLFRSASEPRDLHNACSFVVAARASQIAALAGSMMADPALPPWALVAGFRTSDRNDVIELRYGVALPNVAPDAWFAIRGTLDWPRLEIAARLGAWAQGARQASIDALRDPADQVPSISAPTLHETKRDAPAQAEDITTLRLGLYKLATYRGPVTAWNFMLASALARNLYTGAVIAFWQSFTHSAVYFGNEMAWELRPNTPPMVFVANPAFARLVTGGSPVAARGQPDAPDGPPSLIIDGKQVPLPAGNWTVLSEDRAATGPNGVVLARLDGQNLLGLVVVHSNAQKTTDILGTAADCSRSDIYFATISYDTPVDGFCSYGKLVAPEAADHSETVDPLWDTARHYLESAGISLPPTLMMVGARARTRENFVDARYYFVAGSTMAETGIAGGQLAVDHMAATPASLERVMALQAWADLLQLPLERGVRGRLAAADAALPWPWPGDAVRDARLNQAHAPLLALRAAGAFDDAELQRQLTVVDATLAERERQRWSLWTRSAYKVATYRIVSYIDSLTVSGIITNSPGQTFAYATINAVVQPVMAYINEIGWANSGVGRPSAPLTPVNFPEIGRDRR